MDASPQGLCYTESLRIMVRQAPIEDDCYGSRDGLNLSKDYFGIEDEGSEDSDSEDGDLANAYTPERGSSCAINALVRLLLLKFPKQRLKEFW